MRHHGAESFPKGFGCETDHRRATSELFALFKILPVQADHITAGDLIGLGCKVHHSNPRPLCGRIENVIEWDRGAARVALFAGLDQTLGLARFGLIDQDDDLVFG